MENRQYLITAKHVVRGIQSTDTINVMRDKQWIPIEITDVWVSPNADVALLSPRRPCSPSHPVSAGTSSHFFLSQHVYFLGFPYGLRHDVGSINYDYPIPFVKTGIIASFSDNVAGSQIIYCDGLNNPGFSGGPIVTVDANSVVTVIAVVSAYRASDDPILLNGNPTGLTYRSNTGLVIGYGIGALIDRAKACQSGAPLT